MKVKYVQSISEAFNDPNNHLTRFEFYKQSKLDDILIELCKLKVLVYGQQKCLPCLH